MAKRQNKHSDLEAYARAARQHYSTYAKEQIKETLSMMEPVRVPPWGYRKAGERRKTDE